jgi:hypothetical protein
MRDKHARWTKQELDQAKNMIGEGLLIKDIAQKFGVRPNTASMILRRHGIKNDNYKKTIGSWNIKHKHLRKDVMMYFMKFTENETKKKFGLTDSEFKSLMTAGYGMPELRNYRKDKRTKRKWTLGELINILKMSGIKSRDEIAKELNRGNQRVIKEFLMKKQIITPKYTNGLTVSVFVELFGEYPDFFIQTSAGPGSRNMKTNVQATSNFKIVPWVYIDDWIKNTSKNIPDFLKKTAEAMAVFQEWIHEGNAYANLIEMTIKK